MFDTGGEEEELDVLEPGKSKGVNDLDRVVVDHLGIRVIQLQNLKIYLLSFYPSKNRKCTTVSIIIIVQPN